MPVSEIIVNKMNSIKDIGEEQDEDEIMSHTLSTCLSLKDECDEVQWFYSTMNFVISDTSLFNLSKNICQIVICNIYFSNQPLYIIPLEKLYTLWD